MPPTPGRERRVREAQQSPHIQATATEVEPHSGRSRRRRLSPRHPTRASQRMFGDRTCLPVRPDSLTRAAPTRTHRRAAWGGSEATDRLRLGTDEGDANVHQCRKILPATAGSPSASMATASGLRKSVVAWCATAVKPPSSRPPTRERGRLGQLSGTGESCSLQCEQCGGLPRARNRACLSSTAARRASDGGAIG